MHDIIQRHCAAEATRGIDFSKNFRPSAHAVHLFVGMRKSTARVMPLKSLYRIWRVECGINDSLGVKLDVLVVRVVAADARPLRQEARNSREIRVRNSALDDRAGREQTARLRLSLTIGGASRACRLIKCIRVHRSACIAKSTWMRQDLCCIANDDWERLNWQARGRRAFPPGSELQKSGCGARRQARRIHTKEVGEAALDVTSPESKVALGGQESCTVGAWAKRIRTSGVTSRKTDSPACQQPPENRPRAYRVRPCDQYQLGHVSSIPQLHHNDGQRKKHEEQVDALSRVAKPKRFTNVRRQGAGVDQKSARVDKNECQICHDCDHAVPLPANKRVSTQAFHPTTSQRIVGLDTAVLSSASCAVFTQVDTLIQGGQGA
eukprot:1752724-Prymnesium_polylepis.1